MSNQRAMTVLSLSEAAAASNGGLVLTWRYPSQPSVTYEIENFASTP